MSKKSIRPEGADGTPHARTLSKQPDSVNRRATALVRRRPGDGFAAAEQWHVAFCAAAAAAGNGYLFPTNLRATFDALPEAQRADFLEGIGALMAGWKAYGEPTPGQQKLREDAAICLMPSEQQDEHFAGDDERLSMPPGIHDTSPDRLGQAGAQLDEVVHALESVQPVLRAIKRLSGDTEVVDLCDHVRDILTYQYCCVDELITDLAAYQRGELAR